MKIVTIVGARPQFIKAASVSRAISNWNRKNRHNCLNEIILHTGQHFDHNMSQAFFDQLSIPAPKYNLEIHGGGHGWMTGRMLEHIEELLMKEKPDWVLIYGDTNSTLAGALAGIKLHIPVAHVEAGLRSFNMKMPEEVNRIVADSVSTLLLCPTETAVRNLTIEGHRAGVYNVGDVMFDASLYMRSISERQSTILEDLNLKGKKFILVTCHRAENTDIPAKLRAILSALVDVSQEIPVVFPLHPRTKALAAQYGIDFGSDIRLTDPLPYLDMIRLESVAAAIATDSGGVQKEAYFYKVPCITFREETEWVETLEGGWNRLAPPLRCDLAQEIRDTLSSRPSDYTNPYGEGNAAEAIIELLVKTRPVLPNQ